METAEPIEGDAFGQLLLECWEDGGRPGVTYEIVERDDGFVGISDAATYFTGPDEWQSPEQTFDTFLLYGANLALLGPAGSSSGVLHQLAEAARPGARIVGSCLDPYATASPDHLGYHELNRRRGRLPGHLRIRVRHRRLATPWFDYVFRSPDELVDAAADSPWDPIDIINDGPAYVAVLKLTA